MSFKLDNYKDSNQETLQLNLSKVKSKKRILKATGENQFVIYKGKTIRPSADFSAETL